MFRPTALILIVTFALSTPAAALTQAELDTWHALWTSQGLEDYGYQFQRSCHCFGESIREAVVRVESGNVVYATDSQTRLSLEATLFPSVEELFAELQSAVDRPAAFLSAEFDAALGYPVRVSIDWDEMIADEETFYVTSLLSADLDVPACDFTNDIACAAPVIDLLREANGWFDSFLDFNEDFVVDSVDREFLVQEVLQTNYGDSNLDGAFNSSDFVQVFRSGEFEDSITANSSWSTGDWNGDFEFSSSDLVKAFQAGGYQSDSTGETRPVPEPNLPRIAWLSLGIVLITRRFRRCQ
ncbi:MAG: DUF6174 domain-containing protein [Pirellulaceae bacterium]